MYKCDYRCEFPFEIQIGINGQWEGGWPRQMDRVGLKYERSENKFLGIDDWQWRAQQLLDEQLATDWVRELDALARSRFIPRIGVLLGPISACLLQLDEYFMSEWATDTAFHSGESAPAAAPTAGCVRPS